MNILKRFWLLDRKDKFKVSLAILTVVFLLVGSTYAYFQSFDSLPLNVPTTLQTTTNDSLLFEVGGDLSIQADILSFASGKGNQTSESYVNAVLRANSNTHKAEGKYSIYLDVSKNEFVYSAGKPEILLKITRPDNIVMSSELYGVTYKSVADGTNRTISGYDITTYKGILEIAYDYEISTTWKEEQKWKFELIFVNLPDNQSKNGGKVFESEIRVRKEEIPFHERCSGTLACDIAKLYTGTQGVNGVYYHMNYANSAEDRSYRYAGSYGVVNNYVCFGYDDSTKAYASGWCPNDNLYRIIGVFDNQIKLIKADFATTAQLGTAQQNGTYTSSSLSNYKGKLEEVPRYYWSGSTTNDNNWINSTLRSRALDSTFYSTFNANWKNKMALVSYQIGGNSWSNFGTRTPSVVYKNEVTNPAADNAVSVRLSLMYISDYLYAASPNAWTLTAATYNNTTAVNSNWMYMGIQEWMITPLTNITTNAVLVNSTGNISNSSVGSSLPIRPVFYLDKYVKKAGGIGTSDNPYRIVI